MLTSYRHTQPGTLMRVVLGLVAVFIVVLGAAATPWFYVSLVVLLAVLAIFHNLSVEVNTDSIDVAFGIGLIRRSIPLARVASCQVIRTPWYFGWGIRYVFKGWMWNVSGLQSVELTYVDGGHFRIGTDEPEALAAAIESALAAY